MGNRQDSPCIAPGSDNLQGIAGFQHGFDLRGHTWSRRVSTSMRVVTMKNFRSAKARIGH